MPASDSINFSGLMDDAKCFALVRPHRWHDGICCPGCSSSLVIRGDPGRVFVHNARRRGKALLGTLIAGLKLFPNVSG